MALYGAEQAWGEYFTREAGSVQTLCDCRDLLVFIRVASGLGKVSLINRASALHVGLHVKLLSRG